MFGLFAIIGSIVHLAIDGTVLGGLGYGCYRVGRRIERGQLHR